MKRRLFFRFILIIYSATLFLLSFSVLKSGIYYQYDVDELGHVQYVYLLATKFAPYKSFFSRFTPFFSWFQMPIFYLFGFNFQSIFLDRVLMAGVFILRMAVTTVLIWKIVGTLPAFIFLPLLLMDPFTVFVGMQIRPDNLMMLFFIIGLLVFFTAVKRGARWLNFAAGFFLSISLLILLKIIPSIVVVLLIATAFFTMKKKFSQLGFLLAGFTLPWLLFLIFLTINHLLKEAIQQVFWDSMVMNNAIKNPMSLAYFFRPNNLYVFGYRGKSLTWLYVWLLPLMAFLGFLIMAVRVKLSLKKNRAVEQAPKVTVMAVLLAQMIWTFSIRGFFLQYFLTISWLWALFAGVFMAEIICLSKRFYLSKFIQIAYVALLIIFAMASIRANLFRSTVGNSSLIEQYEKLGKIIPRSEPTYPNLLFHPVAYPLTYGTNFWDLPESILRRYGPVQKWLDGYNIKYILLGSYAMDFVDYQTKEYILDNYQMASDGLFIRK